MLLFVVVWVVDANVVRTKFGRAFRAIRENEEVAQSFGVSVARYKLTAFVLSGALAGVAGAMFGHLVGFVDARVVHVLALPARWSSWWWWAGWGAASAW